jgi:hypothetical protein
VGEGVGATLLTMRVQALIPAVIMSTERVIIILIDNESNKAD